MTRNEWIVAALVVLLVVGGGGAVVVVTKTREGFLRAIVDEVRRQLGELRPDLSDGQRLAAARLLAAQAALESGYGKTQQFRQGFNFGNVSAGSSWTGPVIGGGDTELDANDRDGDGNRTEYLPIAQRWRKYASLGAAVSDFFVLLSWTRYRAARDALLRGDAAAYARELRAGGYYTAPEAEYRAGLTSALRAAEAIA